MTAPTMDKSVLAGSKRHRESSCPILMNKRSKSVSTPANATTQQSPEFFADFGKNNQTGLERALTSHTLRHVEVPSLEQLAVASTLTSYLEPASGAEKEPQPRNPAPCLAVVPCSDPQCEDVLPCPEPADWCQTLECLGDICYDPKCDVQHHDGEVCCDEPCPEGDHCNSPCYSPECDVPTCGSPCPESPRQEHAHYPDPHVTYGHYDAANTACGCIDPKCLEAIPHWHCHDPHHEHHFQHPNSGFETPHTQSTMSSNPFEADLQGMAYPSQQYRNIYNTHDPFYSMLGHGTANPYGTNFMGGYTMFEPPATPALTHSSTATPATTGSYSISQASQSLEPDLSCHWSFAPPNTTSTAYHICGQRFESAEELHRHVEKVHIEGLPREDAQGNGFYCRWEGCDRYLCRSFQARPKLKRHMQTHTLFKPFICSQCGVQMKTKDAMEKHERTHTGERPYRCQVADCASTFATSTELKTHMVVHSGEKPHQCPICHECFADSSNLSKHKKTHFVGMYKCPDCGARMKRWDQMRRHIVTQNHATILMEDKRAQQEYKVRMEKEFRDLPDAEKALGFVEGDKIKVSAGFRGGLGM
ncbi:hypothetical protein FH972_022131 [Carpinus fangiana]|uniref:C2H2-type domain-containing protein n=1 Tax=Carpinus fangiana TaxID=176857 RepID=A0A5N6KRQ2_9ROSI|nr:hypothetical protein FH972_022131 [Carpinus fangiana]